MKIAICLYGSVGFKDKLGGSEEANLVPLDINKLYDSLDESILRQNDCDIFIHSWSVEREDEILKLYKPKNYIIEKQKLFSRSIKSKKQATLSRWYSEFKSNELKSKYEIKNGFNYDLVLHTRFDLKWFNKFDFSAIDKNYLYVSHWNESIGKNKLGPYDKNNVYQNYAFMDLWFLSGSKIMDSFSNIYKFRNILFLLNYFRYNNHRFSFLGAKIFNLKTKFILFRGFDYEIFRRFERPDWKQS